MNAEIKFHLRVLEFPEDKLPKMKELRKRYIRLSLLRHPDKKDTGTDAAFKELLEAYKFIGNLIDKESCDETDRDEQNARTEYRKNNFEKINKTSVTIKIMTSHVLMWEKVFTENYGAPIDRSDVNNSKQWAVNYNLDDDSSGVIKVTIWNLVEKEKSTMLVQGENQKQFLNISFAEKIVPQLFHQVLEKVPRKLNLESSPVKMKDRKKCKKCTKVFTSIPLLNKHMLSSHEEVCKVCERKFSTLEILQEHIKEHEQNKMNRDSMMNAEPLVAQVDNINKCDSCENNYESTEELNNHINATHMRIITCIKSDEIVDTEDALTVHKTKSNSQMEKDRICVKNSKADVSLKDHTNNVNENTTKDDTCCYSNRLEIKVLKDKLEESKKEEAKLLEIIKEKEKLLTIKEKDAEKLKKLNSKIEKDTAEKLKEQKVELQKSFGKIDSYVAENTTLKEEIKTLNKLIDAKDKAIKEVAVGDMKDNNDTIDVSLDLEDDYVSDYYFEQSKNRLNRTGPMVQAQRPNMFNCNLCVESFVSQGHLNEHMRRHHKGTNNNRNQKLSYCRKCNFSTNEKNQLTKHLHEEHGMNKRICYFWKQGRCNRMENCLFLHPEPPRCRLQSECHFWPNCRFTHVETPMCFMGVNCQNFNCMFEHPTNLAEYQVPEKQNDFLFNPQSQTEFPPLTRSVERVWRPW